MTNTSPAQCRFCADHYLSYRCLLPAAGALIDAAIAGVEDDASIAAAAEPRLRDAILSVCPSEWVIHRWGPSSVGLYAVVGPRAHAAQQRVVYAELPAGGEPFVLFVG